MQSKTSARTHFRGGCCLKKGKFLNLVIINNCWLSSNTTSNTPPTKNFLNMWLSPSFTSHLESTVLLKMRCVFQYNSYVLGRLQILVITAPWRPRCPNHLLGKSLEMSSSCPQQICPISVSVGASQSHVYLSAEPTGANRTCWNAGEKTWTAGRLKTVAGFALGSEGGRGKNHKLMANPVCTRSPERIGLG